MRTVKDVLHKSKKFLDVHNVPFSRRVTEDLLAHILKMSRMDLYLHFDRHIDEWEWKKLLQLLQRQSTGEPLQYLFKKVDFFHCEIEVSQDALIPRQETEILLSRACEEIAQDALKDKVAFDICCGTGCIGLGLKKRFDDLHVILSDLSPQCIALAKRNAKHNDLQVTCLEGDLLEPFKGIQADYVFCNPPYISADEYKSLERSVKDFEPKLALIGGETGLEYYQRLAHELPKYLKPKAMLFLEIGKDQRKNLFDVFSQTYWKRKVCYKDWSGHDRFFFLEFE